VAAQRRKFQRPLGERRYKKLFLIAAEGIKNRTALFRHLHRRHLHRAGELPERQTRQLAAAGVEAND